MTTVQKNNSQRGNPQRRDAQRRDAASASASAAAERQRKKIIIAVCLVAVMAVLWVKLLMKKHSSAVAETGQVAGSSQPVTQAGPSIVYCELPVISGRQDVLARDIFASNGWKGFRRPGEKNAYGHIRTETTDHGSADIAAAAKALELAAIVTGNKYQAFIGNKLVVKGQKFDFLFQGKKYVFKVVDINDERVELKCSGLVVVKKMIQPNQTAQ